MELRSTRPSLVRATGSVSDARPSSTRKGCEREKRRVSSFVMAARAWSANALVEIGETSSMIPPRACGRTLPHSASTPDTPRAEPNVSLDADEGGICRQRTEGSLALTS